MENKEIEPKDRAYPKVEMPDPSRNLQDVIYMLLCWVIFVSFLFLALGVILRSCGVIHWPWWVIWMPVIACSGVSFLVIFILDLAAIWKSRL